MSTLEELPERVHRAIIAAIVLYFVLVLYANATGDRLAFMASRTLFGVVAVGVGAILLRETDGKPWPVLAAGVCFVAAGVAQLAWVVTDLLVLDIVATTGALAGIGLYFYAVWVAG